jgi:hypothetical protein
MSTRTQKPRESDSQPEPVSTPYHSRAGAILMSAEQKATALATTTVPFRVELIFEWMVTGEYVRGRSDKALADLWEVDLTTVHRYSAEANRILTRELISKSREELLAELVNRIANIGQNALERTEEVALQSGAVVEVRRPDHRTALRAAEAAGELLGLKVQRHHHTVQASELTTEQIIAQLAAQGVRVELPAVETTGEPVEEHGDKDEAAATAAPTERK